LPQKYILLRNRTILACNAAPIMDTKYYTTTIVFVFMSTFTFNICIHIIAMIELNCCINT
jgi:hypothetical protein